MIAGQIGHLAAAFTLCWLVLVAYRYVARRSQAIAAVMATAILLRAGLGAALFWISYLDLPIAESLQAGGGFWQPALDATGYYEWASQAADAGTLFSGPSASPFYVDVLALWMILVGISPAAGTFLNLCLYAPLVVVIVRLFGPVDDWRRDLPCIVAIGAYSFSPVLVFHSTQPLKDELFNAFLAVACLGTLGLGGLINKASLKQRPWALMIGTIAVTATIYAGAGIRSYYPLIIWCTLVFTLVLLAVFTVRRRTTPLPQYVSWSGLVLLVTWLGVWASAPEMIRGLFTRDSITNIGLPSHLFEMAEISRKGFLTSGGATNIVIPLRDDAAAGEARAGQLTAAAHAFALRQRLPAAALTAQPPQPKPQVIQPKSRETPPKPQETPPKPQDNRWSRAVPASIGDQVHAMAIGLSVVFVPLSLLMLVLNIEIPGGLGLLPIIDVDTIWLDAVMIGSLWLLWRRRHDVGERLPFVIFGLSLSVVTALLLGYVVTNYGTLWRMRPLVAIPVWLLAVAVSPRNATSASAEDTRVDAAVQRPR